MVIRILVIAAFVLTQQPGRAKARREQRETEARAKEEATSQPASAPTSRPTPVAPDKTIDTDLKSDDPEVRLDAFARWHRWVQTLPEEGKAGASAYLEDAVYLRALGDVALYEMRSDERRLAAYKILAEIEGQQVYPYFLWGATDMDEHGPAGFAQDFFDANGDPTLIGTMPASYRWQKTIDKINARWSGKEPPTKNWEAIDPNKFIEQLADGDPRLRRLAIRACSVSKKTDRMQFCTAMHRLLGDADGGVRTTALESLTMWGCPDLCGRLKKVVDTSTESGVRRRLALQAVAVCGAPVDWTAEWIIDNVQDWPPELDDAARETLIRLRPKTDKARAEYKKQLERLAKSVKDERTQKVLTGALAGL